MHPRLSWLGFLTLAGAAAAAETADACLRNLGPQQVDEVCGSDGVVYDSYAHALCHNAVDAGWRRGTCERRALSEDFEGPQEEHHGHPSHPYLALAFIGGGLLLGILTQLALHRWLPSFPFALAVFLDPGPHLDGRTADVVRIGVNAGLGRDHRDRRRDELTSPSSRLARPFVY